MHLRKVLVLHHHAEEVAQRAVVAALADRSSRVVVGQDVGVVVVGPFEEDIHPGREHAIGDVESEGEGFRVGGQLMVEGAELEVGEVDVKGADIVKGVLEGLDETHLAFCELGPCPPRYKALGMLWNYSFS
jgi:hypothetical protein